MPLASFKSISLLLVLLVLVVGGCGNDEPVIEPDQDNLVVPQPSTPGNDITSAVADAGLDTLTRLLRETGLADSLRGEGPYTVFAPSDLAFTQLPAGRLDGLSPAELMALLSYHVIPGRFETSSLAGSMDVNTLHGGSVTFSVEDAATVRDGDGNTANLESPDMNVDNGVIHIIDRVLMPGPSASQ